MNAVLHIASPCRFDTSDPKEVIVPAVEGTVNLLRSCSRNESSIRRVVMTSSTGAVYNNDGSKGFWSEKDWNDDSVQEAERLGTTTDPRVLYMASKVHAERAAWSYMKENQQNVNFDLIVLHPPCIFGPTLTPENPGLSYRLWRDGILGTNASAETNPVMIECVIHTFWIVWRYLRCMLQCQLGGRTRYGSRARHSTSERGGCRPSYHCQRRAV